MMKVDKNCQYYISITLIILVVLIILYSTYGIIEKYIDTPAGVKHGGFNVPTDEYTLLDPYNYTQTEFIKLQNVLDKISNENKIRIKKPNEYYKLIPAIT